MQTSSESFFFSAKCQKQINLHLHKDHCFKKRKILFRVSSSVYMIVYCSMKLQDSALGNNLTSSVYMIVYCDSLPGFQNRIDLWSCNTQRLEIYLSQPFTWFSWPAMKMSASPSPAWYREENLTTYVLRLRQFPIIYKNHSLVGWSYKFLEFIEYWIY